MRRNVRSVGGRAGGSQPKVSETSGLYGGAQVAAKTATQLAAVLLARTPLLLEGVPINRSFRSLCVWAGTNAAANARKIAFALRA